MFTKQKNNSFTFVLFLSVLCLTGCAGAVKNMAVVPVEEVMTSPMKGKSMVVFLRPSALGFGVQSSVFEVKDETVILAGIVAAKKKVSYELDPGEHLFMVIGENADFMTAELEPNKTYFALVSPRMGMWKARFVLEPIHADVVHSSELEDWLKECEWVKKTADSETWARSNMPSIQSKRFEFYEAWKGKGANDRLRLLSQDGR